MVSMEAKFCTARIPTALCPELERPVAPDTELKLALKWKILNCHPHRRRHQGEDGDHDDEEGGGDLGAGEMHAAALGERVAEVARRTTDPVLRQVGLLTEYDHCHRDYDNKNHDENDEARPQLLRPGCPDCSPPSSEQSQRTRFPRAE